MRTQSCLWIGSMTRLSRRMLWRALVLTERCAPSHPPPSLPFSLLPHSSSCGVSSRGSANQLVELSSPKQKFLRSLPSCLPFPPHLFADRTILLLMAEPLSHFPMASTLVVLSGSLPLKREGQLSAHKPQEYSTLPMSHRSLLYSSTHIPFHSVSHSLSHSGAPWRGLLSLTLSSRRYFPT
jgi:hypothetical protein